MLPTENVSQKNTHSRAEPRTSSRIFFQMIRVISSPSSSTTGFFTAILSSESSRQRANQSQPQEEKSDQPTMNLRRDRERRPNDSHIFDIELANPLATKRELEGLFNECEYMGTKAVLPRGRRPIVRGRTIILWVSPMNVWTASRRDRIQT